jgi:putative salt-induced outer membrane protein
MKNFRISWLACLAFVATCAWADPAPETTLKHESEAGIVITSGNSQTQTFNLKHQTTYTCSLNTIKAFARYLTSSSNSIESARNWGLGVRYERSLSERWSAFLGQAVESDLFAGYLQRYNTDVGGKYSIIQQKEEVRELNWFVEAGYRYSRENRITPPDLNNHMLRFYTEANRVWNAAFSTKLWIEYLPNLSISADYQLNTELSLSAVLTSVFSLKTAYLLKYDGLPVTGAKNTDAVFTTALVAKF